MSPDPRPLPAHVLAAVERARSSAPPHVTLGNLAPRAERYKGQAREPGAMNRTEAAWDSRLALRLAAGEVLWYVFQQLTFKLAHDTRYTPDFVVLFATGQLEAHDTKGEFRKGEKRGVWLEEDARAKTFQAATIFPWIRFVVVIRGEDETWREVPIKPGALPRSLGPR